MNRLKRIIVDNLFGTSSYIIDFDTKENISILTGNNGFGKSTLLSLLNVALPPLDNDNDEFDNYEKLFKVNFYEIVFEFENKLIITIKKSEYKEEEGSLLRRARKSSSFLNNYFGFIVKYEYNNEEKILDYINIYRNNPFRFIGSDEENIDGRITITSREELSINEYLDFINEEKIKTFKEFGLNINVNNITTKRIEKTVFEEDDDLPLRYRERKISIFVKANRIIKSIINNTITKYNNTFNNLIADSLSNIPNIKENEHDEKVKKCKEFKEKIKILFEFKENKRYFPTPAEKIYEEKDKMLMVRLYYYAIDKAIKEVEDDINKLIEFKKHIDNYIKDTKKELKYNEDGVYILVNNNKIDLESLSSGEKNQLMIFYEIIFNSNENTIVLIDEPELSNHISYQAIMLDELLNVSNRVSQMILATHSPFIIGDRVDLVVNKNNINKGIE